MTDNNTCRCILQGGIETIYRTSCTVLYNRSEGKIKYFQEILDKREYDQVPIKNISQDDFHFEVIFTQLVPSSIDIWQRYHESEDLIEAKVCKSEFDESQNLQNGRDFGTVIIAKERG